MKICDSIAVKTYKGNSILLGVGNELRYYDSYCNGNYRTLPWRLKRKIHGIDVNENNNLILIYGEKQFDLLSFEKEEFKCLYRGNLTDWISSGKIFSNDNICFVTGRLFAIELEYDKSLDVCIVRNKRYCQDRTTLYCSYLLGNSWEHLIIFGGTAMDVIVWKPVTTNINKRLSGKNGVTLSIDANDKFGMLITTSDDRSLKMYKWRLSKDQIEINSDSFTQSYAHTARVFQGKIIVYKNNPFIVTVGEDSNMCVWDSKGHLIFKRLHHFGSPIWSLDYDIQTNTVFTTSADGNCRKYGIYEIIENYNSQHDVENIDDFIIMNDVDTNTKKIEKLAFLASDKIIVGLTNQNNLVVKVENKGWEILETSIKNKCSILKTFKNTIAIVAFNVLMIMKYDVLKHSFTLEFQKEISKHYIKSMFFFNEEEYLVCDEVGRCVVLNNQSDEQKIFSISGSREPWITCAYKFEKYLLISSRQGNLFLYCLENDEIVFQDCIKKINGSFGVTSIVLENNSEKFSIFKTYGHDNMIKVLKLCKEKLKFKVISREHVPIVWVEKVTKHLGKSYIAGFNSNEFVLWNKEYGDLVKLNCGGGHRFWDFYINFDNNIFKLIYIKKGKVHTVETSLRNLSNNVIEIKQNNWHTKECNAVEFTDIQNIKFILSGGEDNILKIFNIKSTSSLFENELILVGEMFLHISCIKTITTYKNHEMLLIVSAGGRAQICVTEFNAKTLQLEEKCNYMLKSTDFDRNFNNKAQDIEFDPETRFMAIDIVVSSMNEFEIYAGCSDGFIRKFVYLNEKINFVAGLFYNKCILHLKIIDNNLLITAATDGKVKFWNLFNFNSNSKAILELKHHESGINSIDIFKKYNNLYILTGGDDQNIVFSIVKIDNGCFHVIERKMFNKIHTAQVTGVKLMEDLDFFYSTSVDQTICKYNLQKNNVDDTYIICVADIKGLKIVDGLDQIRGFVYGCGIESF